MSNKVALYDPASGKEKQTIAYNDSIASVALSLAGATLPNLDSISYLPLGNQWVIYTHDDYWNYSPRGCELLGLSIGMQVYNIDLFTATMTAA